LDRERSEPVFHAPWEGRAFAIGAMSQVLAATNIDAFRHAIERLSVRQYLGSSYYGRWTHAAAVLLIEAGVIDANDLEQRTAAKGAAAFATVTPNPPGHRRPRPPAERGITRNVSRPRLFEVGQRVVIRPDDPAGHTRVPGYVRGRPGRVFATRPACPWPDRRAHGVGEDPQWLYAIRFETEDLWGADAEPGTSVTVDVFEPHLLPGPEGP
jgi:nitrile hydratase beta subunit